MPSWFRETRLTILLLSSVAVAVIALIVWALMPATHTRETESVRQASRADSAQLFERPAPKQIIREAVESTVDVEATFGSLEGHVTSAATGRGIDDAEVVFEHDGTVSSVMTDSDGRFSFQAFDEGAFDLESVTAAGFAPFERSYLEDERVDFDAIPHQRVTGLTIVLEPMVTLSGAVVDADGITVPGATVGIVEWRREARVFLQEPRVATDERGEFAITWRRSVMLRAEHPELGSGSKWVSGEAERVEIVVSPQGRVARGELRILVKNEAGQAVPGARVVVLVGTRTGPSDAMTNGAGRATVPLYELATSRVKVSHPDYGDAIVKVDEGRDEVEIVLTPEAVLRGSVTDAETGAPVSRYEVYLGRLKLINVIDPTGRYEVRGMSTGVAEVGLRARGYLPATKEVMVAGSSAVLDFALERGVRVHGVVTTKGGEPIAGATVFYGWRVSGQWTKTDGSGEFELAGLPSGRSSVSASAQGYHQMLLTADAVGTREVGPLRFELEATAGATAHTEYAGIGAQISSRDGEAFVMESLFRGGAAEAGLERGDEILGIEGRSTAGMDIDEAIELIRGPEGTTVRLRVHRKSTDMVEEMEIERRRIRR